MVPRTFTLTGSVEAANTLLTAWISVKIEVSASTIACPELALVTAKYLPLPWFATLFMSAVMARSWFCEPGSISTV